MGVVLKQSIWNTVTTYFGFALGAINVLFLFTKILDPEYYGLVSFILATGALLMPIMAMGVHNSIVRFYSGLPASEQIKFLNFSILIPLLGILPLLLVLLVWHDSVSYFISQKNELAKKYVWYIFLVGLAMAYFEVFFAWSKIKLRSVFGTFMREVFARLCTMILLILLFFEWISIGFFLKAVVFVYIMRTILMKTYAYALLKPKINFSFPKQILGILTYGTLMVLGGSAALIIVEIDKFMINQYLKMENIAFYNVSVFIASVIIVPSRAMHQITYPLTAKLLGEKDFQALGELYKRTSLALFVTSGFVFVLILTNLKDLYSFLPKEYRNGYYIVLLLGLAKVFDSLLGNVNSILYNSKYHRTILFLGVLIAISTILFNMWFIPKMGINGAALASCLVIFIFNLLKMFFVGLKFHLWPFSVTTFKVLVLLVVLLVLLYLLPFSAHPILSIGLKTLLAAFLYALLLYRFVILKEFNIWLDGILNHFSILISKSFMKHVLFFFIIICLILVGIYFWAIFSA